MNEKISEFPNIKRDAIAAEFRRYLLEERGLCLESVELVCRLADKFLAARFPDGGIDFAQVRPDCVARFVRSEVSKYGPSHAKSLVSAMRALFRFWRHCGFTEVDLAGSVPSVPEYSLSTLPKYLPSGSIERILEHCDRTRPQGRRDYAILLLLARLGLRGGEIVGLTLDDVAWDLGQITVRGKGGRLAQLPLPADAGKALADYLKQDRPRASSRRLFLTLIAPFAGFSRSSSVSWVVKQALARAGVKSARKGAHLLRHTLATEMLQRGASLNEIGELLRHRSINTTRIYAKVDLVALRKLALPWPGGAR